jgi:hypothetical protein
VSVALLRDLAASPRPTGSEAIASARARVAGELRAVGLEVREHPFGFSAFPGNFATPLLGVATLMLVAVAGHLGAGGHRWAPLVLLALGGLVMFVAGRWIARHGILSIPLLRMRGINLAATPPGVTPRVWLCAHLDTKSQPIPTLVRVAGVAIMMIGYVVTLALALAAGTGASPPVSTWAAAALLTLAGAIPVMMSVVGSRSPGALDNASGVATVVEAARQLGGRDVGVLITDAEELGMAGARAWALDAARDRMVLNCDGVDDAGPNVVLTGGRPGPILDAVSKAARTSGLSYRSRTFVPGLLTDSVAFADAGIATVTFMRGSLASLARVHGPSDNLTRLHGTGIAEVAGLMSATARTLGER